MTVHTVAIDDKNELPDCDREAREGKCAIIGLGTSGSHTADSAARLPDVHAITLIDLDGYDAANLRGQLISASDVGMHKVDAQERRLKAIDRNLDVKKFARPVEEVPLGFFRGRVILGCVDNLSTRIWLSQVAWRTNSIYIDSGVQAADGKWVRVTVYVPGPGRPCLECALGPDDYAQATTNHPCQRGRGGSPAATGASANLGATVAGIQTVELEKLLTGGMDALVASREITLDLLSYQASVAALWPNPACLFDHRIWDITPLHCMPEDLTLDQTLRLPWPTAHAGGIPAAASIRLEGRRFSLKIQCRKGHGRDFVHILSTLKETRRKCRVCGDPLIVSGVDLVDRLTPNLVLRDVLGMSLRRLGIRRGDVISVNGPNGDVHYEIKGR